MKLLILSLLFSNLWASESCQHTSTSFKCVEYIRAYDGDTITFSIPNIHPLLGKKINIRVKSIDTAEIRGKKKCEKAMAITARDLVRNTLRKAKRIDLENVGRGKYFRIVADVLVDGVSISDLLVKNNLAYGYSGGRKPANTNWCKFGMHKGSTIKKIP